MAFALASVLDQACPEQWRVVPEPAVMVSADTEFAPDVVVAREQLAGPKITEPPLLVVEVRSPSTAQFAATRPFPAGVIPSRLVAGLKPG